MQLVDFVYMDSSISLVIVVAITHFHKDILWFLDDRFHLFQDIAQGVAIIRIAVLVVFHINLTGNAVFQAV